MAFEREMATFDAHLHDLLSAEGKYVVVREDQISGPFATFDEALGAGYDRYALEPFLVKQIRRAEPIHYFSRDLPACPA